MAAPLVLAAALLAPVGAEAADKQLERMLERLEKRVAELEKRDAAPEARNAELERRLAQETAPASGYERVAELYYRYRISKQVGLSPDFQYISSPGGNQDARAVSILGLRAQLTY